MAVPQIVMMNAPKGEEESTSDKNLRLYGTRTPNVEDKKRVEAFLKAKDQAYMQSEGGSGGGGAVMDGLNELGQPVPTAGMSENEAFFAKGRALDKKQLEGYKSFGDKSRGESINAVRELTGRPSIANTPQEFEDLVNKSLGFGGKSALNTPEGRQRAISSGVGAGLSADEATARVQKAYGSLQSMGKLAAASAPPEQYGPPKALANAAVTAPVTPAAPKPPSAATIAAGDMPTQTPEQAAKEQVGNVIASATGFGEEGRNAAFQAAQGGRLASDVLNKFARGAVNKEVDVIAEAGGRTRTSLGKESKSLLEEYNKAKGATAKMTQLAKGATEGSPLAKGLATVTQKATEAGTKSTDALKALQSAAQRTDAQKAADLGRKVLGSKILKGASRLGGIAQVAEPIFEAYKYNKNPELFDEKVGTILDRNEAGLLPTVGAAVRDTAPTPLQFFNPNYSPVSTMSATIVAPIEAQRRLSEAQGELAFQKGLAEVARRRGDELTQQRRTIVSDEDYAKMSAEQKRESSMKAAESLRQIREAARKRNE